MTGGLIIDKPAGITSHDVVARVRRAAKTRRVGHAGTLDPFATGVLVVCVGRATRLVQYLVGLDKEYVARVRFGYATDTQDFTGKQITPFRSSKGLSLEELKTVLGGFKGEQLQVPPMYSAKKVGGERLHKAAREGREIERSAVRITIHSIDVIESNQAISDDADGTREFDMRVVCTSGTYIRTLAHDIGERLGVGAHLSALRRTSVGSFKAATALSLEEVERLGREGGLEAAGVTPSDLLAHLPAILLDDSEVHRIATGRAVETAPEESLAGKGTETVRLLNKRGELVAVGSYEEGGNLVRPKVVLVAEGRRA
jgi:tRNA pseudouridine55 synthase